MQIKFLKRIEKDDGRKPHWDYMDGSFIIWKKGSWIEPYEIFEGSREEELGDYLFCAFTLSQAVKQIKEYQKNKKEE